MEVTMGEQFMLLPVALMKQHSLAEIRKCNEFTSKYGLQLSEGEIHELAEHRREALESSGRVEFGGGVIQKIILEFADSPYLIQDTYDSIEIQSCSTFKKSEATSNRSPLI
jgi:hypothetical protein